MFEEFDISAKANTPEEVKRRANASHGYMGGKSRAGKTAGHKWSRQQTSYKMNKLRQREKE